MHYSKQPYTVQILTWRPAYKNTCQIQNVAVLCQRISQTMASFLLD